MSASRYSSASSAVRATITAWPGRSHRSPGLPTTPIGGSAQFVLVPTDLARPPSLSLTTTRSPSPCRPPPPRSIASSSGGHVRRPADGADEPRKTNPRSSPPMTNPIPVVVMRRDGQHLQASLNATASGCSRIQRSCSPHRRRMSSWSSNCSMKAFIESWSSSASAGRPHTHRRKAGVSRSSPSHAASNVCCQRQRLVLTYRPR